ncbi:hypothetical protein EVG20_g9360 [Dentipellis fragilis]|uniref:Uncharacterized protein n=1 Tax=Dentipellis fragilis TaxID=205917 RepID=A0A4Y9XZ03_9AGAM|nr:hypothetical protein EVG20_g9360 [Dentipellis fragilis]
MAMEVVTRSIHRLSHSPYHYVPTEWTCALFVALYSLTTSIHILQAGYFHLWWLFPTAVLAGICEIIGWSARLWPSENPTLVTPYLMQIITTIMAPTFFVSANFIILGRIIRRLGQRYSHLSANWYTILFFSCDIVALVVQAIGGAMASQAVNRGNSPDKPAPRLLTCIISAQLLAISSALSVSAAPLTDRPKRSIVRRDGGSGNVVQIVVPVVVVVVFLASALLIIMIRKGVFSKFSGLLSTVTHALAPPGRHATANNQVRELTAEEIAGPAAVAQARPAARTRRNRRTPSQISTRSLPVYMKEPGEHELVIIQGSQDMEDAPMSTHIMMPSVPESDSESINHSRNISQSSSVYVVVPSNAHVQTPLLANNEHHDNDNGNSSEMPTPDVANERSASPRRTSNDNEPNESRAALLQDASPMPDIRGDAPPYFEVVGDTADESILRSSNDLTRAETTRSEVEPRVSLSTMPSRSVESPIPEDSAAGTETVRRRSMFRGFIHAASHVLAPRTAPLPATTARPSQDSVHFLPAAASAVSLASDNVPEGARAASALSNRQGQGHRPSFSGSASAFSLSSTPFRTVSRTRTRSNSNFQAGHLTSPSTISINSISSPLTHTLTRTDFVYPKSGPTPEQLKLISSREAVGKYGVPYGPDAVAYVASTSRLDLHGPSPEYDVHTEHRPSIEGLPAAGSSGLGHIRNHSRLDQELRNDSPTSSLSEPPVNSNNGSPTQTHTAAAQEAVLESPVTQSTSGIEPTTSPEPAETTQAHPEESNPNVEIHEADENLNKGSHDVSSPPGLETHTPAASHEATKPTNFSSAPTAFRMPISPLAGVRSESRASSLSYATADTSFPDTPMTPEIRIPATDVSNSTLAAPSPASDTDGPPTPRAEQNAGLRSLEGQDVAAVAL